MGKKTKNTEKITREKSKNESCGQRNAKIIPRVNEKTTCGINKTT